MGVCATARAARCEESRALRELFGRAFLEDEGHLWAYLAVHDPALTPESVRVVAVEDAPVACAVVLARRIRTRRGWVRGAILTLVACDPVHQHRGYGSLAVKSALDHMAREGMAVAVLYGHPAYYERFGFVPVLPGYETTLDVPPGAPSPSGLRPVDDDDLPALVDLYSEQLAGYPLAVARAADSWLWTPRNPARGWLLALPDRAGYAFVAPEPQAQRLWVHEAAAVDGEAARRLLAALTHEARRRSLGRVSLGVPPEHPIARTAVSWANARQSGIPPGPGMAIVTDWEAVLPAGYSAGDDGLYLNGCRAVKAGTRALTRLALGTSSIDDLVLGGEAELTEPDRVRRDFPRLSPKWSLAPFWT